MTLVVADTSVVLNLCCIQREDLLRSEFEGVLVPEKVEEEFMRLTKRSQRFSGLILPDWIQVMATPESPLNELACFNLDPGEEAALILARQVKADAVLMDESLGRRAAEALGIRTLGILGILLRAKARGSIVSVLGEMDRLENIAGFWVDPQTREQVLKLASE